MLKLRKLYFVLTTLLVLSVVLAACGDATATPATATTAAPVTSATAATTVAATSAAPATTVAATTAAPATSAAATTAPATTAAATTAATGTTTFYDAGGLKVLDPRTSWKTAPAGKKGGNLNLAATTDAKTLHYYLPTDTISFDWLSYIYSAGLVETDIATGLPGPNFRVVTALKVSDDKLTYTYTLKDGIKWSDGKPITSADYVWTNTQALKPENKWPYVDSYAEQIESVTAPDEKTVVFKMKKAEIYAINQTGTEPLPKHIWEGKDWSDGTKNTEIDNPTVVSGPWKLKEWKRGQFITFARNDASTIFPVPYLDTVTIQIVPQTAVQVQKYKAGELDSIAVSATDYDEAKKASNGALLEYYRPSFNFQYIGFNFRKTYLQNVDLRKALAYATPQKDIIDKLLLGLGQPIFSAVPITNFSYNQQTPKYEFSLDKAKQTLTSAGYKLDGGKLKDKSGQELPKLKILYNPDSKVREGIATISQQNFKELGIDIELVPLEFQTYVQQIKKEPFDYDMFILGWQSGADVETFDDVWKAIPSLNSGGWDTEAKKQVVDLYAKARQEFDIEKRKGIMGQIQTLLATDLPYIFLYQGKTVTGVSSKLNYSSLQNNGIGYNLRTDWSIK